ncbi:MAG: hypothetical protein ACM3PW_18215, partial [Chlamydiota bacterium]
MAAAEFLFTRLFACAQPRSGINLSGFPDEEPTNDVDVNQAGGCESATVNQALVAAAAECQRFAGWSRGHGKT